MNTTLGSRIGQVITEKKLKKVEFAARLKIDQSYVTQLTSGRRNPSDRLIIDICQAFGVNENWLRTGNGPMFIEQSDAEEIDSFIKDILQGEPDFRRRVVSVLSRMTQDEWLMLEKKALELLEELNIEPPANRADEIETASPTSTEDDEEAYRKSLDSVQKEESTA